MKNDTKLSKWALLASLSLSLGLSLYACSDDKDNTPPPILPPDGGLADGAAGGTAGVPGAGGTGGAPVVVTDGGAPDGGGDAGTPSVASCLAGKTYLEILNQGAACFPAGATGVPFDNARIQPLLRPARPESPYGLPLPTEGLP